MVDIVNHIMAGIINHRTMENTDIVQEVAVTETLEDEVEVLTIQVLEEEDEKKINGIM
jgi:hypothetical protein